MQLLEATRKPEINDAPIQALAIEYYTTIGQLIEEQFGGTPLCFANFPWGLDKNPVFHFLDDPQHFVSVSLNHLKWAVYRYYALEFHTWAPSFGDENRLRFGRILLTSHHHETAWPRMCEAANVVRSELVRAGLHCIPLVDGVGGIALWIPLSDAPEATVLREWLNLFCANIVANHAALISTEPNVCDDDRVHLHVSTNARRRCSALPYSLRGNATMWQTSKALPVCTPVQWHEIPSISSIAATSATIQKRIEEKGDVFAKHIHDIGNQTFARATKQQLYPAFDPHDLAAQQTRNATAPKGDYITAAIAILEDGKTRTVDEIVAEALERKLVQPGTLHKYMYSALIEYIARQIGRGRKPPIVQDAERRFRINEPADEWPDVLPAGLPGDFLQPPATDAATQALIDRLETSSTGTDPTAFEIAVCDAFAHLGFATRHLGTHGAPDGIMDAILGPLGYRVIIECKSAPTGIVHDPDVPEAAKFRDPFGAQLSVLVGPSFSNELELLQELQTHNVTALAVTDLQTLLSLRANPREVRDVLVPGYASDVLSDLLWDRCHGETKRLGVIAALLEREGWKLQQAAITQTESTPTSPQEAARLTVDTAIALVDEALRALQSTASCTREEVERTFEWLTNPLVRKASWLDKDHSAIILLSDPSVLAGN